MKWSPTCWLDVHARLPVPGHGTETALELPTRLSDSFRRASSLRERKEPVSPKGAQRGVETTATNALR